MGGLDRSSPYRPDSAPVAFPAGEQHICYSVRPGAHQCWNRNIDGSGSKLKRAVKNGDATEHITSPGSTDRRFVSGCARGSRKSLRGAGHATGWQETNACSGRLLNFHLGSSQISSDCTKLSFMHAVIKAVQHNTYAYRSTGVCGSIRNV